MVNYTAFLALRRLRGIMCVELYNEKKGKQQGKESLSWILPKKPRKKHNEDHLEEYGYSKKLLTWRSF